MNKFGRIFSNMSHAALEYVGVALYIDMTFASNPPHNFSSHALETGVE